MRKFEKISFEQFKKDVSDDIELYNSFRMPCRKTYEAAGYDFFSLFDFVLKPGETIKLPTGIKMIVEPGEFLWIVIRGSQGFKYNVQLTKMELLIEIFIIIRIMKDILELALKTKEKKITSLKRVMVLPKGLLWVTT